MHVEIRFHSDHIAPNDLAVFAAVLHAVKETSEVSPEPARPAARKAPAAKPAPAPEPEPIEVKPTEEPTETKLAAAKRELAEEVTKLASRVDLLELSDALSELGWRAAPKPRRFRHYGPQRAFTRPANESLI